MLQSGEPEMRLSPKPENLIRRIPAIDVHAHYGIYDRRKSAGLQNRFMTGDVATVVARASESNIEWTVVSPLSGLIPRSRADAAAGNDEATQVVDQTPGSLQWIILDPLQPRTFEQAHERLAQPKCVGIMIHPEEHGYKITEHGKALFEFAAQHDAVILAHSGNENSLPADFIP